MTIVCLVSCTERCVQELADNVMEMVSCHCILIVRTFRSLDFFMFGSLDLLIFRSLDFFMFGSLDL